jgi:cytochrome c peroxidase
MVGLHLASAKAPRNETRPVEKSSFARPLGLPSPSDNPQSFEKVALGERLFNERRLSRTGTISCATCHDPRLGFSDGTPLSSAGATKVELRRHTPTLWNLAWAPTLYWDGRAASLEAQARFPMSHPDEMAGSPEFAATTLRALPDYVAQFKAAFPGEAEITGDQILKAIAAYERTLVSPPTRFDAWIAGDVAALDAQEQRGFAVFTGKAQCANCHNGFGFTDFAFHDIGLPGADRGRGAIVGLEAVDYAFKTPTLRELTWSAPYMHDGSLATLEDVVQHYETGGLRRPSRSPDMPRPFTLTSEERAALVAFLTTLSSETPPRPSREPWIGRPAIATSKPVRDARSVSQRNKTFWPESIVARRGERITILNDDTRTHNLRIVDRLWNFNSGSQEPGESVMLKLDHAGRFVAHCGIHPTMRLTIEVE